jgi:hypothetical protein
MLQRTFQSSANQPGVEGIVTVLDQDGPMGETEERSSGVPKLRRSNQHRPVDVVALLGVRIDWRSTVDQCVEESEGAR